MSREGYVGDVVVGGFLGHKDHKVIEFPVLGEVRMGISRTVTWNFRRADIGLSRNLIDRVTWEAVLNGKCTQMYTNTHSMGH